MRLNSIAILLPSFTLYQNAARKGRTGFALHRQGAGAGHSAGSCSTLGAGHSAGSCSTLGAGTPPPFCFPPCGFAPLPAALHPAGLAADKDPKMRRNPQSTPECSLRVRCAVLGRVGILLAGTAAFVRRFWLRHKCGLYCILHGVNYICQKTICKHQIRQFFVNFFGISFKAGQTN